MFRLPVSREEIAVRRPGGAEDMLLLEARELDRAFALGLVARLTDPPQSADMSVHDFEAVLLHLHGLVFGKTIAAEASCRCGQQVDITFPTAAFLAHRRPRRPRGVIAAGDGWFAPRDGGGRFRLPTVGDQIAASGQDDPAAALAQACMRDCADPLRTERAMSAMAPALSGEVEGSCPHCNGKITGHFDVVSFVLGELRVQASLICEHVHALASHYHWTEEKILALPNWRRQHYVDIVAGEREGIA